MNNPLKQYFRRPAVYLTLPSRGNDYEPGVVNIPENGELPVYPMTAIDEITSKTPDALFNGTAVADLIKSCVPDIQDPWKISSTDMDAILLAIKAASGSQNLEVESKCPKCEEQSIYTLDIAGILTTFKSPDYTQLLEVDELKIKFGPLTYREMNEAGLAQFEVQKLFQGIAAITDEREKTEKTTQALLKITTITMAIIAKTIKYIETPNVVVEDHDHILEFLNSCDKQIYLAIRDYHNNLKEATAMKPLDIKCPNCGHEYQQPYVINASDFFG